MAMKRYPDRCRRGRLPERKRPPAERQTCHSWHPHCSDRVAHGQGRLKLAVVRRSQADNWTRNDINSFSRQRHAQNAPKPTQCDRRRLKVNEKFKSTASRVSRALKSILGDSSLSSGGDFGPQKTTHSPIKSNRWVTEVSCRLFAGSRGCQGECDANDAARLRTRAGFVQS